MTELVQFLIPKCTCLESFGTKLSRDRRKLSGAVNDLFVMHIHVHEKGASRHGVQYKIGQNTPLAQIYSFFTLLQSDPEAAKTL